MLRLFRSRFGGLIATGADQNAGTVSVEAVDLRKILAGREYDFIKIDIEGAEGLALAACRTMLGPTRHLFLEFHSRAGQPHELGPVLDCLSVD